MMQMLELVPYLRDKNHHDFGHIVHKFRFGADMTKAEELTVLPKEQRWRDKLGLKDPLQGIKVHTEVCECDSSSQFYPADLKCSQLHVPMSVSASLSHFGGGILTMS